MLTYSSVPETTKEQEHSAVKLSIGIHLDAHKTCYGISVVLAISEGLGDESLYPASHATVQQTNSAAALLRTVMYLIPNAQKAVHCQQCLICT